MAYFHLAFVYRPVRRSRGCGHVLSLGFQWPHLGRNWASVCHIRGEGFAAIADFYQERFWQVPSSSASRVNYPECIWAEWICEQTKWEGEVPMWATPCSVCRALQVGGVMVEVSHELHANKNRGNISKQTSWNSLARSPLLMRGRTNWVVLVVALPQALLLAAVQPVCTSNAASTVLQLISFWKSALMIPWFPTSRHLPGQRGSEHSCRVGTARPHQRCAHHHEPHHSSNWCLLANRFAKMEKSLKCKW